jgi:predicted transcriptional regulator of viral defense system
MGYPILQSSRSALWALAKRQHGVITRRQLLELGFSAQSIKHRVANGRLHRVRAGVYAVGRPQLPLYGRWLAAVLACGPEAAVSHETAAALWGIRPVRTDRIEISVPINVVRRQQGILLHRRAALLSADVMMRHAIPVTSPVCTLIDLATRLDPDALEVAINEADKHDLADPEDLRSALEQVARRPGVKALRELLDQRTFSLTDSELERRFLPVVREAGLPAPATGRYVNGFKVDFYWPALGLIVETDGLRYHRTPAQQARDRVRDQTHTAAGLTPLRFTRAQVRFDPHHVQSTLAAVARRLRAARGR